MKKRTFIFVLICILLLTSSCANGGDAPSTDTAMTTARLEDQNGGKIRRPDSVICETEEEYARVRESSDFMDRLLTKSTCEEAAKDLYDQFYENLT